MGLWRRIDESQAFLKNIERHRDHSDFYDKQAFEELETQMRVRKKRK